MNLDKKLTELDALVEATQNKDLSLDESLAMFDKAIAVAKDCLGMLSERKGKLTELSEERKKLTAKFEDDDE